MKLKKALCLSVLTFVVLSFAIGNIGYSANKFKKTKAAKGYPAGYRMWISIAETGIVLDESSQFFGSRRGYLYKENPFSGETNENGNHIYEPGDRIVLEFRHAEQDVTTDEVSIGEILWIAVMTKETMSFTKEGREHTERTSGWSFQAFDGTKQKISSENCFSCHKDQAENDFVFFKRE